MADGRAVYWPLLAMVSCRGRGLGSLRWLWRRVSGVAAAWSPERVPGSPPSGLLQLRDGGGKTGLPTGDGWGTGEGEGADRPGISPS